MHDCRRSGRLAAAVLLAMVALVASGCDRSDGYQSTIRSGKTREVFIYRGIHSATAQFLILSPPNTSHRSVSRERDTGLLEYNVTLPDGVMLSVTAKPGYGYWLEQGKEPREFPVKSTRLAWQAVSDRMEELGRAESPEAAERILNAE